MTVCLGHAYLRTSLKLAFSPKRHFKITKGATHDLKTLSDCVGRSFIINVVLFHNEATPVSASVLLQDVSTCTLCL